MLRKVAGKDIWLSLAAALPAIFHTLFYRSQSSYPMHVDEWFHWNVATGLRFENWEYFFSNRFDPAYIGFHALLLPFTLSLKSLQFYFLFPVLLTALTALIFYFSVLSVSSRFTAVCALIFFSLLPSDHNYLGVAYFTPLALAIPLALPLILRADDWINIKKSQWLLVATLIVLGLIHPSSFLLLSAVFLIWLVSCKKKSSQLLTAFFFSFLIIAWLLTNRGILPNRIAEVQRWTSIFTKMSFPITWATQDLNPFLSIGPLIYCLALVGLAILWKLKKQKFLCLLFVVTQINWILFPILERSIFAPYQRNFYWGMITSLLLAAFGGKYLFDLVQNWASPKYAYVLGFLMVIGLSFIYFEDLNKTTKHILTSKEEFLLLAKIRSTSSPSRLLLTNRARSGLLTDTSTAEVIAPKNLGNAVYAIARKRPSAGIYHFGELGNRWTEAFFAADCGGKKNFLANHSEVEFIISDRALSCDFLSPIESRKNWTLFRLIELGG